MHFFQVTYQIQGENFAPNDLLHKMQIIIIFLTLKAPLVWFHWAIWNSSGSFCV